MAGVDDAGVAQRAPRLQVDGAATGLQVRALAPPHAKPRQVLDGPCGVVGATAQRVEIFDMRGRFLDSRELSYNSLTKSYNLDLKSYQTGVYTLKLYSDEREYIRRAIISTY